MVMIKHMISSLGTLFQNFLLMILRLTLRAFVIAGVLGVIAAGFFTAKGYQMYQGAIREQGLEERIEEVESDGDYIALYDISEEFRSQLVESEDRRFYKHCGIDIGSIMRAAIADVKAGAFVQGGSTITQQLAKNLYFSSEKKIERKIAELFVVYKLEKEYSKDKILELYSNIIYFGESCYGVQEAASNYYNVDAGSLNKEQAAGLVFTIKCPNVYNPNVYARE